METKTIDKKKITLFTVIAHVGSYIIKLLTNGVYVMYIDKMSQNADAIAMTSNSTAASNINSFVNLVLSLVLYFVLAKLLTSDRKKIISFIGSIYFGVAAAGIISSLFSAVSKFFITLISASNVSLITLAGDILSIPVAVIAANFAFSALEGLCNKLPNESAETIDTSLSKMRKTFIIAYVLMFFIVALFTNVPNMIFSLTFAYEKIGNYLNGVSSVLLWVSNTLVLAVEYFLAYKVSKKHIDAVAFMVVLSLADRVASLIQSALVTIINTVVAVLGLRSEDTMAIYSSVTSIYFMLVSILSTVIVVVLIWKLLKVYFPESPKSQQTEAVQPMPYEAAVMPQATAASATLQDFVKDIEGE